MDTPPFNPGQNAFQPPIGPDHELPSGPKGDSPLPSVGSFIREIFDLYSERMSILLGITLIPAALSATIGMFDPDQGGVSLGSLIDAVKSSYGTDAALLAIIVFSLVALVAGVMEMLLSPAIAEMLHAGVTPVEAASRAINRTFSYLWIAILTTFIALLGYLFLIIPGIILQVWFSVATMVAAIQHKWGIEALIWSREFIKGRFLQVLGRMLAILFLFLVFMLITSVGMGTLTAGLPDLLSLFLFNFVVSLFAGSFLAVSIYMLYKHLFATRDLSAFVPSPETRKLYVGGFTASLVLIMVVFSGIIILQGFELGQKWPTLNNSPLEILERR